MERDDAKGELPEGGQMIWLWLILAYILGTIFGAIVWEIIRKDFLRIPDEKIDTTYKGEKAK